MKIVNIEEKNAVTIKHMIFGFPAKFYFFSNEIRLDFSLYNCSSFKIHYVVLNFCSDMEILTLLTTKLEKEVLKNENKKEKNNQN